MIAFIDAHEEGGRGHLTYPLRILQKLIIIIKLGHKNKNKHENRGPPPLDMSQPQAPYVPPQKTSKIWSKNAKKNENRGTPRFSHNPKYPPKKNLKTTVHL
jgi:hypothetical protein